MTQSAHIESTAWFGKLPSKGDFVRGGPHGPAELALETWLTQAVEHGEGRVPAEPVRFVVSCAGEGTLVGAWVGSRDAAGRCFPLGVALRVPADVEAAHWSLLAEFYSPFLSDAEQALQHCVEQRAQSSRPALQQIELPHESALPRLLASAQRTLGALRVDELAQRNFQCSAREALPYALRSLQQGMALDQAELTLDMPAAELADVLVWLELALVLRAPRPKPRCIVWMPSARRLLVCMQQPPLQLLAYLTTAEHGSSRRWPLATTSQAARAAARASLSPLLAHALDSNVTLAELITLVRESAR